MEGTTLTRTNNTYDRSLNKNRKVKRKSRKRMARKYMIISAMLLIIMIFALVLLKHTVNAESEPNSAYACKGYMSIELHENDTLWDIAEKYSGGHYDSIYAYIDEVKSINGLTSSKIWAGEKLVIPVYSDQMSYVSNN